MPYAQLRAAATSNRPEHLFGSDQLTTAGAGLALMAGELSGPAKLAVIFHLGVGSWVLLALGASLAAAIR
jgi:hypothetical protein